ncbi:MAG: hypothetical protein ACI4QE_00390 [Acutalibacteraceae bacterium]
MSIKDMFGFLKKDEDIDENIDVSEMADIKKDSPKDEAEDISLEKAEAKEMEEIFSNKSKKARLKAKNPLEEDPKYLEMVRKRKEEEEKIIEEAIKEARKNAESKDKEKEVIDKSQKDNIIKGENTGISMQTEILMDSPYEDNVPLPEYENSVDETPDEKNISSKEEQEQEKGEVSEKTVPLTEENPQKDTYEEENVTLAPEFDENTTFAKDVITDVPEFHVKPVEITDFDTIDIDLGEEPEKKETDSSESFQVAEDAYIAPLPEEEEMDFEKYRKLFGKVKPVPAGTTTVSRVPVYRAESTVEKLNVRAGKFSSVVRSEYEEYLKSKDPEISNVNKAPVVKVSIEEEPRNVKDTVTNAVVNFFSTGDGEKEEEPATSKVVTVEDYQSPEDKGPVISEIKENLKKLSFRTVAISILTIIMLVVTILQQTSPKTLEKSLPNAGIFYSIINLFVICIAVFVCRVTMSSGLYPLTKLRGNSDTALAVAGVGCLIQAVVGIFFSNDFFASVQHYYTIIVLFGFLLNHIGKLFMVKRVDNNFKFMCDKKTPYAVKIYTDESVAAKMMSGTHADKPIVAYQHKTDFLSNFLQISYTPDPSEDMASKVAPASTICALAISVICGVAQKSFVGAVSAFALLSAVSVPVAVLMAGNIPLYSLCKKLLKKGAMLSGYPAVKQFCDTTALMTTDTELYPQGAVVLKAIKPLVRRDIREELLSCAAVLREADSPLASVFDKLDSKNVNKIPEVESVMYEDGMGLVSWINGERVLVGNRELLLKYGVQPKSEEYEEKFMSRHRSVTYLAVQGEAVALFVATYRPSIAVAKELKRAEENGISILVSTNDCNITGEKISEDFGVYYRTVKVLPTGLGNVLFEKTDKNEDRSRAYIATKGKFVSFARAISGAVKIKSNISLAVIIELIGVLIGVLIMATIALYGGAGQVSTLSMLFYSLFWAIATTVASSVKKP